MEPHTRPADGAKDCMCCTGGETSLLTVNAHFMDVHGVPSHSFQDSVRGSRISGDACLQGSEEVPPKHDASLELVFSRMSVRQKDTRVKDWKRTKSLPVRRGRAALVDIPESCGKRVQFADALGLDLASVKHYSVAEDCQSVTAARQHDGDRHGDAPDALTSSISPARFTPAFSTPESGDFEARLQRCRVALEKITLCHFDIGGLIRALTGSCCRKDVGVRYTFNDWLSFVDVQASPKAGEDCALAGERFAFTLYAPPFLDVGSAVHFAIYCKTEQGEYWDNNEGQNYTLWVSCAQKGGGFNTV